MLSKDIWDADWSRWPALLPEFQPPNWICTVDSAGETCSQLKNSLGWLEKCSSCWKCCVQMNRMAPDSGWPPTVDDMTLQTSLWTSNTLDSPLLPDSGTFSTILGLDFHKMCFLLKPDHCSTVQLFFSFDQVRCLRCCRWFRSDSMHQWWFLKRWHQP